MTPRIEPEEENFDPATFSDADARAAFREGLRLFNEGEYHAAHEALENCWLATQGDDSDFFKGLIQASIALYHYRRHNLDGARKLYSGHRRLLGKYLPTHRGIDVAQLIADVQRTLQPALKPGSESSYDFAARPCIRASER